MRCRKCHSRRVIKLGFKTTANGRLQRYLCNACGHVWIPKRQKEKAIFVVPLGKDGIENFNEGHIEISEG